jgi:hypothetical protein
MKYESCSPYILITIHSHSYGMENFVMKCADLTYLGYSKKFYDYLRKFVIPKIKPKFENEIEIIRIGITEYYYLKNAGIPHIEPFYYKELQQVKRNFWQYN